MLESLFSLFFGSLFLTKLIILISLGLYIAFAFVLSNQIKTLNAIIEVKNSSAFLYTLSLIHVLFAISLFIIALVIL